MQHVGEMQKVQCTGCKMCGDICPKQAITFQDDAHGFWYPQVAESLCVKCGLCVRKCPSLHAEEAPDGQRPEVYAAWTKDDALRMSSTSGGVFGELARHILDAGGVVAGSRYRTDWKSAEHVVARDRAGLEEIRGSKYFQSDTAGIYDAVKKEVLTGKPALFCGTPCQNAALRMFLGQEYENVFYVDFICRSINSPLAFRAYLADLEQRYGADVVKVHLKNKRLGWQSLASLVQFSNGEEYLGDKSADPWVNGFIGHDLYTRESCFQCPYRTLPRKTADITIGDFWGIQNQSAENMRKGISVVFLNTPKGEALFEKVSDRLEAQKHSLEEALPGNTALYRNPVKSAKEDRFFELIQERSFSDTVQRLTRKNAVQLVAGKMRRCGKIAKRVVRLLMDGRLSVSKCVYYNFFCKNIVRDRGTYLLLHKGAVLDLHPSSRIYLHGKNLEIGFNQLKGSASETHVRLEKDATWNCKNGGLLFYNTVVEVKRDAVLNTGFFSANGGSAIVVDKQITLGEDVMIGRNVLIYDSDFHQIRNREGIPTNPAAPVVIEDHVWLTSNIAVLKGVTIGRDSLVAAYSVLNRDMPEHSLIASETTGKAVKDYVNWSRERCPR